METITPFFLGLEAEMVGFFVCKEYPRMTLLLEGILKMSSELIKSVGFWSVVGIIIGFMLGEGSRWIRYKLRVRKLKQMIKDELKSILAQIPQKREIVNLIIQRLKQGRFLSGLSVRAINIGYKQHIAELYEHLSFHQRNCLHVIHERLDIADKVLFSFEHDFASALKEKIIARPFDAYRGHFEEILESYKVATKLIKGYLAGNPEDVFYIDDSEKGTELSE